MVRTPTGGWPLIQLLVRAKTSAPAICAAAPAPGYEMRPAQLAPHLLGVLQCGLLSVGPSIAHCSSNKHSNNRSGSTHKGTLVLQAAVHTLHQQYVRSPGWPE